MTHHPAVTISRSLGSGGTEVGFLAARELGWHFCDRRILRLAADALGQSSASLAPQEERACGLKEWMINLLALGTPEANFEPLQEVPIYSRDLFAVQKRVMLDVLEHAPSVILGRGGFLALKGRPGTLHVSIHADLEFRVESLLRRRKAPDRQAALAAIAGSDASRGAFIRDLAGVDWRDPALFDLVLDTSREGHADCAARIVAAAGRLQAGVD